MVFKFDLVKFVLFLCLFSPAVSFGQLVPDDNVNGVMIEEGYNIELGIGELNFPSNITLVDDRIFITEAGFPGIPPTVKEITLNGTSAGTATVVLAPDMLPMGTLIGPFTDLVWYENMIWLSHRQVGANEWMLGAVSRFSPDDPIGTFETLLTNLPSAGDHSNNTLVFDENGRGYISLGSVTNSGVVGADNVNRWVPDAPGFAETAPVDITFRPNGFEALIATELDPNADAVTAAYRPFDTGEETDEYTVAAATPANPFSGVIAGSGAVYSFDATVSGAQTANTLQLECWGLRNAFGLAFDAADPNRLFISNNGSDIRGQATDPDNPLNPATYEVQGNRGIANDWDEMFVIEIGGETEFFGWPDFLHDPNTNEPLSIDDPLFCDSPVLGPDDCPQPLFEEDFRNSLTVQPAFAPVGPYVSVTGFAPSTDEDFGYVNQLFVTESGSFTPQTGTFEFTGYKVGRYDNITGQKNDFVVNQGSTAEELLDPAKMNKPVSVVFTDDMMLIVDLGVLEPGIDVFSPGTGKIWMVTNNDNTAVRNLTEEADIQLSNIIPNPAANQTAVDIILEEATEADLSLLNITGEVVQNIFSGKLNPGVHRQTLNVSDLAVGVYSLRLQTERGVSVRKLIINE